MKRDPYMAMRRNILANIILLPAATLIVILAIGYSYFRASLEASTIAGMKRTVESHRQMIDSFLSERKGDLAFVLNSYDFHELADPGRLARVFHRLQGKSSTFVDLGVFNEDGVHVAYQGPYELEGKVYKEATWFREVLNKDYFISDIFLGYRRVPHFIIALAREEDHRRWVIRATIDTQMFSALVEKVRIGKTGEAYILNAEGIFQTERRSGGTLLGRVSDEIEYPQSHTGIKTFVKENGAGDDYLYATTWLNEKPWLLVVRQKKVDAFAALRSATYLINFVIVIGGSAIVAVAFYLTGRIIRRMRSMDAEKERLSQQLIMAGRLAELGEMAAGFAHEINNPLQIMKSEQTLISAIVFEQKEKGAWPQSEDLAELEDSVEQIKTQIDRCAEITQAILKFARRSEPVTEDVDLRRFIPEVGAMIQRKVGVHGISLRYNISPDTPLVRGDPAQLQQVMLNLLNNAFDAVVSKHGSAGGEMVVGVGRLENNTVEITVQDNGCGINGEDLKRVFRPFFTTKPVGRGTGLGLPICYGIIDKMGGTIEVSSQEGIGTVFTIRLPVAEHEHRRGKDGRHQRNENDAC